MENCEFAAILFHVKYFTSKYKLRKMLRINKLINRYFFHFLFAGGNKKTAFSLIFQFFRSVASCYQQPSQKLFRRNCHETFSIRLIFCVYFCCEAKRWANTFIYDKWSEWTTRNQIIAFHWELNGFRRTKRSVKRDGKKWNRPQNLPQMCLFGATN